MTTGRINQVTVVLDMPPGEFSLLPAPQVPQTHLTVTAVLQQPVKRRLCLPVDITTLREACQTFAQIAKPTQSPYSAAGCLANLCFHSSAAPLLHRAESEELCPGVE